MAGRPGPCADLAAVEQDHLTCEAEADAGSPRLGREEGEEDVMDERPGDTRPIVLHHESHLAIFRGRRRHRDRRRRRGRLARVL